MAKIMSKKYLQKQNERMIKHNEMIYNRMRQAEDKLNAYEENIAAQFAALTSRYEGIICYLIKTIGWDGVSERMVAEWAEGKEYALKADADENGDLLWVPVVRKVEENEDEISDEVRQQEDAD